MTDPISEPEVESPDPEVEPDAPVEEPDPVEQTPSDDESVQQTTDGFYWVREGDSAYTASGRIYGSPDPTKLTPTIPVSPGFGVSGHLIRTPGVAGVVTCVQVGEDAAAVLKRLGFTTGKKNLSKFHDFNGGEGRGLSIGTLVFMPQGVH